MRCRLCYEEVPTLAALRAHFLAVHHSNANADYIRRFIDNSDAYLRSTGFAAGIIALLAESETETKSVPVAATEPMQQVEAQPETNEIQQRLEIGPEEVSSKAEPPLV